MTDKTSYRIFEHTADIGVAVQANSLAELFAAGAWATTSILIDPATVKPIETIEIRLEAEDLESLFYVWIAEIIYYFDGERLLLVDFGVSVTAEKGRWVLSCTARGEKVTTAKHQIKTYIKAMTYHQLKIAADKGHYSATFVLDI